MEIILYKEEFWICSEYAKNGIKSCNNNTYIGTDELNQILHSVFSKMLEKKTRNQQKIKEFFDFEKIELTKEFIHQKINKIYVERINKDHVRLKINFHFGLEMSEVDKKSICLGLII